MTKENDFKKEVEARLPKCLHEKSGRILYSNCETLKKGDIYLLGLNPGGEPDKQNSEEWIINNVFPKNGQNAYLDECWEPSCKDGPQNCQAQPCKKGIKPLQRKSSLSAYSPHIKSRT